MGAPPVSAARKVSGVAGTPSQPLSVHSRSASTSLSSSTSTPKPAAHRRMVSSFDPVTPARRKTRIAWGFKPYPQRERKSQVLRVRQDPAAEAVRGWTHRPACLILWRLSRLTRKSDLVFVRTKIHRHEVVRISSPRRFFIPFVISICCVLSSLPSPSTPPSSSII